MMKALDRSLFLAMLAALPACATTSDDGPSKQDLASMGDDAKADGIDWCEQRSYYGDGECDRFCARHDPDCPLLGPDPTGAATKYPIIFHHGFAGGQSGILAWKGVTEGLVADGNKVVVTTVPPFDSIEVRAAELKKSIDSTLAITGAAKVNIIAHSMGGLDARYLITTLGYGDRVASLTTISTPHRGTYGGDVGLRLIPGIADDVVNALFGLLGVQISGTELSTNVRAALYDLSVGSADARNAATPDDPRVYYQSWAGVSSVLGKASDRDAKVVAACEGKFLMSDDTFDHMRLAYVPLVPVIGHFGRDPHDGLVSVESAKWGTFKGCIPADHSDEVGEVTTATPNPRTDWDPARFYRQIADDLAARGY
jgi:triacylglycerol lipase